MDSAPLRTVLRVTKALEESGLDYAVGGSIASGLYGEARATFDVDILVELAAWRVGALDLPYLRDAAGRLALSDTLERALAESGLSA